MQPRRLPDLAAWLPTFDAVADATLGKIKRPLPDLVREVSKSYTTERGSIATASSRDALQARFRFFLGRDVAKALGPLDELARTEGLPGTDAPWRILDLGAGLGTTSLGAAFVAGPDAHLKIDAVDLDAVALRGFEALAARASELGLARMDVRTHTLDLRRAPEGPYDLILVGLALNEVTRHDTLLESWKARLRPGGSVVILEPALREVTQQLMALRDDAVSSGWTVFSPCTHAAPCPMRQSPRDWCHEEIRMDLPKSLGATARAAGLRDHRLTFAALVLRRDGKQLADRSWARVVSAPLVSKGKRELVLCDHAGLAKTRRLDRHRSDANAPWSEAARGDLLKLPTSTSRIEADTEVVVPT